MDAIHRVVAWSILLLSIVSVFYGYLDFTIHTELRGNSSMLMSGAILGVTQFLAFLTYRHDSQIDSKYDSALTIERLRNMTIRRAGKKASKRSATRA